MKLAMSIAKNETKLAISWGCPHLPNGMARLACSSSSLLSVFVVDVNIGPGAIALTLIPKLASSKARAFVKPAIAALLAL